MGCESGGQTSNAEVPAPPHQLTPLTLCDERKLCNSAKSRQKMCVEVYPYLLELLDSTLVNTTALVDQV